MKEAIFVEINVPEIEDINRRLNNAVNEIKKCYEELSVLKMTMKKEPEKND